jgi:hypothetical protein
MSITLFSDMQKYDQYIRDQVKYLVQCKVFFFIKYIYFFNYYFPKRIINFVEYNDFNINIQFTTNIAT